MFRTRISPSFAHWVLVLLISLRGRSIPSAVYAESNSSPDWAAAYLFSPDVTPVFEHLASQGIELEILREDIELDVEYADVHRLGLSALQENASYPPKQSDVAYLGMRRRFPAGTIVLVTKQVNGDRLSELCEPHSADGWATWKLLATAIQADQLPPMYRLMKRQPLLTVAWKLPSASAPDKVPLTFDLVYGKEPINLNGQPASGFRWIDDQYYVQKKEDRQWKVEAASGANSLLFDPEHLANRLSTELGIELAAALRLAAGDESELSPQFDAALFRLHGDYVWATLDGSQVKRLTDSPTAKELATFSPDGRLVAFIQDYDLYVADTRTGNVRRLTSDGHADTRNGKADWVYFEEVYSRSWKAYRWSPDSQRILFQRFDDRTVDRYTVLNDLLPLQEPEVDRYPIAGRPNPQVKLGVVEVAGGAARFLDLHGYSPDASLITHFVWQPDSRSALVYVQDRAQTWLDVLRWDTAKSDAQRLFRETTKAWVDNPGDPSFLADGSFLLTSERDGWRHLYHFAQDGSLTRQITSGPWEVRRLHAVVDDAVYVSGTRDSHLAENLYRIRLDGTEPQRITDANYHHELTLSPQGRLLIDTHSRFDQSIKVQLLTSDGRLVRTIDSNPIVDLGRVELPSLEWQSITMRDGFVLDATLIKPPGFDATRKYPVWLRTYGGPHAPTLGWGWQSGRVHERLLAQMGIIAFRFDPRSASGRGACSAWTAFRQLGVQETLDIEDAVDWLTRQSFVDPQRIGLSGHSYGGFLTAYVMTHSTKFAAGISGVPVTDWRNYDTIYTERYMDLPQNNPSGYARTSVVDAAGRLHGRLLLLHGARDDNVHIANSMQFARALQQADAQFELMVYPDNRHGISGPHYDRLVIDFIRRTMLGSDGSRPTVPTASAD